MVRETDESDEGAEPVEGVEEGDHRAESGTREKLFGREPGELPRRGERLETHTEVMEQLQRGLDATREGIERWDPEDRERAEEWFGSSGPEVQEHLRGVFSRIDAAKDEVRLRPAKLTPDEAQETFAYVQVGSHRPGGEYDVHVGPLYAEAGEPPDSKSGILVHELSHFPDLGDTLDSPNREDYGQDGARRIASERPDEAIWTADNIEFFYEAYEQEVRDAR